jgi:hypothetical protein
MPEIVEIGEELINSELIWSFSNVKRQLLDPYPHGRPHTEILRTINGQSWQVDFYPNGKDDRKCVDLLITFLIDTEQQRQTINASCYFMLEGLGPKKLKYAGYLNNQRYEINKCQVDSSIRRDLLDELTDSGLVIAVGINELKDDREETVSFFFQIYCHLMFEF